MDNDVARKGGAASRTKVRGFLGRRVKIMKGGKSYEEDDFIKLFSLIYSSHSIWSG